jgi:hypothetical protein
VAKLKPGPKPQSERPIKVPLPFDELVSDILKAGPHPEGAARKPPRKQNVRRGSGSTDR